MFAYPWTPIAESWPGARKFCLFYRPWQLTGYWEQGPNDTATQQISTSSASCSFEQIWSLPPSRHNGIVTAEQPSLRVPPPFSSHKTSWSAVSLGHSCTKGSFPSPRAHPNPNWQHVCISGEQILPLAWEFNGQPFKGGCVLRPPALWQGYMWPHTATAP